jgi:hypothetical protein
MQDTERAVARAGSWAKRRATGVSDAVSGIVSSQDADTVQVTVSRGVQETFSDTVAGIVAVRISGRD